MTYPQKVILNPHQREIMLHRLEALEAIAAEDVTELFNLTEQPALDLHKLEMAVIGYRKQFSACTRPLTGVQIECAEDAEILAECLEGSTFFGNPHKGDSVYRHAAKSAAELLSTILDRDIEAQMH